MIRRFVLAVSLASLTVGALGTGVAGASSVPASGSASCIFRMVAMLNDPFDNAAPITTPARIAITVTCFDGLGDNTAGVVTGVMKTAHPGRVDVTGNCGVVTLPAFHVKTKWWAEQGGAHFQKSRIEFPGRTVALSSPPNGSLWTTAPITQWGQNPNQSPGSFAGQTATVSQLVGVASSCSTNGSTRLVAFNGRFDI